MPVLDYPAVAILGPTASGKSRLAMTLAPSFRGEIVNCDALQVYRHMNIGTAKPGDSERRAIPHHLLDLRDPGEDFSAGDYQRAGREALSAIRTRGGIPFVVGGTGFYLRSLIDGLFEGPGRSEELRARMREIIRRRGSGSLHRALHRIDPESADRIAPADSSRILRAYEVFLLTGRPMSLWHRQPTDRFEGFRWLKMAIEWPRTLIYQRINQRVAEMVRNGFLDEVKSLLERFPANCHAFKAIGYRQMADHLEGRCSIEEAVERMQQESRRYAKRQLTWFRAQPDIVWLEAARNWMDCESEADRLVREFLK